MAKVDTSDLRREVRETRDAFTQLQERIKNLEARIAEMPEDADESQLKAELDEIAAELNAIQQEVALPTPAEPTEPEQPIEGPPPTDDSGQPV